MNRSSYQELSPENKARIFDFEQNIWKYNIKLHALVLKKLGLSMIHIEAYDAFSAINEICIRDDKGVDISKDLENKERGRR